MLRYFLIFFLFVITSISNAEIKDKILQNLKDTKNFDFKFEQNINRKIGSIIISACIEPNLRVS